MLFRDIGELFNLVYVLLLKGGWILLAGLLLYMFYLLYMEAIQIRWYNQQKWLFLKITPPKENEKSPLAFEQIFNQLHSLHATFTWAEKYLEGQFQIWFTWEMVSIGGTINNYVKILEKHRDTLEAAVYSQFPEAEISEDTDYFQNLAKYRPETSEFNIFAFNFRLAKEDSYPIRTYYDFEHSAAETFVDPIDGVWEAIGKLNSYEMFIIQYIIRPIDDDWKEKGYKLVKKLKGEPDALKEPREPFTAFLGKLLGPILDVLVRPSPIEGRTVHEPPPSLMLHLSEGEKEVISAIERNLKKLGYQTKIQCMYITPREKYNPSPAYTALIGAFKSLRATDLNGLKPDTDRWTKVRPRFVPGIERLFFDLRLNYRKRRFMNRMRRRWYFHGPGPMILNSEELATVLHFPRTEVVVPPIEKVTVSKIQPPPELPVVP